MCTQITLTTVKSLQTYGSERQAVVELLSFSQVMLASNPSIQCLVMLKVCRHLYRPYFYLPKYDIILRTNCDIHLDSCANNQSTNNHDCNYELIGSFILALLMHHLYNLKLFIHLDLKSLKCGWAENYATSDMMYNPYIQPQYNTQPKCQQLLKHHIYQLQRNLKLINTVILIV